MRNLPIKSGSVHLNFVSMTGQWHYFCHSMKRNGRNEDVSWKNAKAILGKQFLIVSTVIHAATYSVSA